MANNYLNDATKSRGVRNNNPGNLIRTSDAWKGKIPFDDSKDSKFEQFTEMKWGVRAFYKNAITNIKGSVNTVEKFITKYAPKSDNNDTASYIKSVANTLGLSSTSVLPVNQFTLKALAKAVFIVENGKDFSLITEKDYQDGLDLLDSKLEVGTSVCKYCGHALAVIGVFFFTYYTLVLA